MSDRCPVPIRKLKHCPSNREMWKSPAQLQLPQTSKGFRTVAFIVTNVDS